MRNKIIKGLPLSLFDNHIDFLSDKLNKNLIYIYRWNKDLENYIDSYEFIEEYTFSGLINTLIEFGFKKQEKILEYNDFSIKGDTIQIWQGGMMNPLKFIYFGDILEEIQMFDILTGRTLNTFKNFPIFNSNYIHDKTDFQNIRFTTKFNQFANYFYILDKQITFNDLNQKKYSQKEFDYEQPALFFNRIDLLKQRIKQLKSKNYIIKIISKHKNNLDSELQEYCQYNKKNLKNILQINNLNLIESGLISKSKKIAIYTDREIFGTIFVSNRSKKKIKSAEARKLLSHLEGEIEINDYIVHEDYGVALYKGFVQEENQDYLKLEYAQKDELFVPLDQVYKLSKYIGQENIEITRLSSNQWKKIKRKIKKQVAIRAKELARHYAKSKLATALIVNSKDSKEYLEFINKFKFEPTPDQKKVEKQIILDMSKKNPMSRLLIGDVGFGKTEIIMRAVFKVIEKKHQAIILCPTTVLALQHFNTFKKRFQKFDVNIKLISRFNSKEKNIKIIDQIKKGNIDIVIGTHRILSNDFKVKNMGILIVDEEQKFGVKQKEKIRKLEYGVHTLFVSATPIPRTLSMALSAIQDISLINTPPKNRKSVKTFVSKIDWNKIANAINYEIKRNGQVFFVHNEVKTIQSIKYKLKEILPNIKFEIAHGQLSSQKIDQIMTKFYKNEFDCLISTTIIENGIDMKNVNTLIVNNSQNLGLSQMYQLRGRVGRSEKQAYAYFFYKGKELKSIVDINKNSKSKIKNQKYIERLETILSAQSLSSGFKIASRDLEIRGAGNLLGAAQHGNITKIGYSLYMQMLAEEIEKLK